MATTPALRPSLPESHASVSISTAVQPWRRLLSFVGPGFLIAVGYMDPGNWATDLAAGSRYGCALLFVVMVSNLMAIPSCTDESHCQERYARDPRMVCDSIHGNVYWYGPAKGAIQSPASGG